MACVLGPKNVPKPLPKRVPNPLKIDVKNVLFFDIDFFGFRPRFWRVLGLQVRRAACCARRVKSYCMLLALTYCFACYRGGPHGVIGRVFGLHVGAMLASLSLLGASWAHFSRLAARVGAVGRFSCVLECSGHNFGTSWALISWLLKRPWPHFSQFFCTTCVMAQMR